MATFFDATSTADQALLTLTHRTHADLATVAEQAESDVIGQYVEFRPTTTDLYVNQFYQAQAYSLGDGYYVMLRGYNPDSSLVDDAALVKALKWTIADTINWRLAKYGESPLLESVSTQAGSAKTFKRDARSEFPPGDWDWRLKRWDARDVLYST